MDFGRDAAHEACVGLRVHAGNDRRIAAMKASGIGARAFRHIAQIAAGGQRFRRAIADAIGKKFRDAGCAMGGVQQPFGKDACIAGFQQCDGAIRVDQPCRGHVSLPVRFVDRSNDIQPELVSLEMILTRFQRKSM